MSLREAQNQNVQHNKAVYNGELGTVYDTIITLNGYRKKKHREHFKEMRRDIRTIADLGCGTGEFTLMLYDAFPNATIYAVDVSAKVLDGFMYKLTPEQQDRTVCIVEDMEGFLQGCLPLDMVVLSGSLHHMITWQSVLQLITVKAATLYLALEPGRMNYGPVKRFLYYAIGIIDNNTAADTLRHTQLDGADPDIGGGLDLDEVCGILHRFDIKVYPGVDARYATSYFIQQALGVNRHFTLLAQRRGK